MKKKNKRIHLDTLAVGESFAIPSLGVDGTVIKHGAMGVRVILDGVISYDWKLKIVGRMDNYKP